MLYLRTLGGLSLDHPGASAPGAAAQPRRLAVLAVLAVSGRPVQRDRLLAWLWPESDTERARGALKQALYALRRDLQQPELTLGGTELRLNPAVVGSDVGDFLRAVDAGDVDAAVALYRGPLLDGVHLRGAPELEQWLDEERRRLAGRYRQLLERAARDAAAGGDAAAAVRWWRLCAAAEPLSAAGAVGLMEALWRAGDASAALQHARIHAVLLESELGCPPDPAVLELEQRIRALGEVAVPASEPAFVPAGIPAAAAVGASAAAPAGPRVEFVRPSRGSHALRVAASLLAVVLLVAAAVALKPGRAGAPAVEPRLVSVLPFHGDGDASELQRLGSMAADWLIQGLAGTDLDLVPLGPGAWRGEVAAPPGVPGITIGGRVAVSGDSLTVLASVRDHQGRPLGQLHPARAAVSDPLPAFEQLRQQVLAVLGAHFDEYTTAWASAASPPTSFDAYRAFAAGMEAFTARDWGSAIEHYERAATLDTSWTVPLLWLGFAYGNSGRTEARAAIAKRLRAERARLGEFEAAIADYHFAAVRLDSSATNTAIYEATRRLVQRVPDSEWLFLHAGACLRLNRPAEGVAAIMAADPDRGWLRGWKPYWIVRIGLRHLADDIEGAREDAKQAAARYPDDVRFSVRYWMMQAALGDTAGLEAGIMESDTYAADGTHLAVDGFAGAAAELEGHGHPRLAAHLRARGIAFYRSLPESERRVHANRYAYAMLLLEAGHYAEAQVEYDALVREDPSLDHRRYAAVAAVRRGDHAAGEAMVTELLASGDSRRFEDTAELLALMGRYDEATARFRTAMERDAIAPHFWHLNQWFLELRAKHPPFNQLVQPRG